MADVELDVSNTVRRVGEHYIAIGEYSDLWMGELEGSSRWASPKTVAIKVLRGGIISKPNFQDNLKQALENHGRIWKTLRHDNVARFYGLAFNCGIMPALVLDYYPNGNVNEFVKRHSLKDHAKLPLIQQVALGMKYLHEFQPPIIHGDIRGANVLINAHGQAVLADYDLVSIIDSTDFTSAKVVGTCRWTAPELMLPPENDEEYVPQYSFPSDIFAFAMTIVEILTENPPFFEKKSDTAVLFAILQGKRPQVPLCMEARGTLATLIQSCWDPDPNIRPPASEICQLLEAEITPPPISGWTRYFWWFPWPFGE